MESERRDQILANVEHAIEGSGEIVGRHEWGTRTTAYEVRKHTDADYHLLQFRGPRELLEQLDHNLKITDGILRHRIIKLRPGTPPPPDLSAAATAAPAPGDADARRVAPPAPRAIARTLRAGIARFAHASVPREQQNSPICGADAGFPRTRT